MSRLRESEIWVVDGLRDVLVAARRGSSLDELWPLVSAWLTLRAPGLAAHRDVFSVEVCQSSGDHDLDLACENPAPADLEGAPTWFSLAVLRSDGGSSPEYGVEFWWPEDEAFLNLTDLEAWDTGNLIGLSLRGTAGASALTLLESDVATTIRRACGDKAPVAVTLVERRLNEL